MSSLRTIQVIGLVTFLAGVLLLLLVFFRAQADLARPLTGGASALGIVIARQIGLLFIMGYVGSSLAGRGVQLFLAGTETKIVTEEPDSRERIAVKRELPPSS